MHPEIMFNLDVLYALLFVISCLDMYIYCTEVLEFHKYRKRNKFCFLLCYVGWNIFYQITVAEWMTTSKYGIWLWARGSEQWPSEIMRWKMQFAGQRCPMFFFSKLSSRDCLKSTPWWSLKSVQEIWKFNLQCTSYNVSVWYVLWNFNFNLTFHRQYHIDAVILHSPFNER